jgi:NAD-dependent deacetylase
MLNLVVLTGAGISAESGVPTFRASDGLWCGHAIEAVATPEGYGANPDLVNDFYNQRRRHLRTVQPNAAHLALARLAAQWEGRFLLVTQNVDDLHDRAQAQIKPKAGFSLIHMHGALNEARCTKTGQVCAWSEDILPDTRSPFDKTATLRPHIVWFGEMPLMMDAIAMALNDCDLFVSIGTSGNVYPAAGFVSEARRAGAKTLELNLEPSLGAGLFHQARTGKATDLVSAWVDEVLPL